MVLTDDDRLKPMGENLELLRLFLTDMLDRHTAHDRYDLIDINICHSLIMSAIVISRLDKDIKTLLELRALVTKGRGKLKILVLHGTPLLLVECLYLGLKRPDFWRDNCRTEMDTGSNLIKSVDGLVRERAVIDVARCLGDTCLDGLVAVDDMVILLVTFLYILEDEESLLCCCLVDYDLLESALQSPVFLYALAVFLKRSRTDTLYCASCQCRLQYVGSIH